jgi:6-aminohexanoate-oligomer endohydrolase
MMNHSQIQTEFDGPLLRFDFPNLLVGVANYVAGPTGCTVLYFPKRARCVIDLRGGSPGTSMANDGRLDALCFAGGSAYGLEAASGVSSELLAMRSFSTQWHDIAIVRAAVIYDFPGRKNAIYPDHTLGRAAILAARAGCFPLGRHGAGSSALVGKAFGALNLGAEEAGQGGAFLRVRETRIVVFTVVNAMGGIVDRRGDVVRGLLDRKSGERVSVSEIRRRILASGRSHPPEPGNTTLTAVITNQKLSEFELKCLAKQVHCSMARGIQPFHAWNDGDVLFAVTTDEVEDPSLDVTTLGLLASELAWDAVLCCFVEGL